jgi:hypothetical protein
MFYFIGIIVTFFLASILISKKDKTAADWTLALWLVCIGLHLISFYMVATGKSLQYPHLLGLSMPFPLLHGPLLYLYTEAVTNPRASIRFRIAHFIPFFGSYLMYFQFFLLPADQKILVFENEGQGFEIQLQISMVMIILSGIIYVALSLRLLARHARIIQNEFSYAEKINLAWLRYLIYGIGMIWVMVIFGNDPLIYSTAVLFVIFLGYFGIKQVGIFSQPLPSPNNAYF